MPLLERFARTLVQRLGETPGGPHRAVSLEEIRTRLLPYRVYRSVLGFENVEDYDGVVLRLAAGEGGYVRTFPPQAAELFRAEVEHPAPNLELLDQLSETTVQIGTDALERIFAEPGDADADAVRGDLALIEDLLEPEAPDAGSRAEPEPLPEPAPAPRTVPAPGESCRACGQSLPGGRPVVFCPWCGERLVPFTCPRCGTELASAWRHCITCGTPVKDPYRPV